MGLEEQKWNSVTPGSVYEITQKVLRRNQWCRFGQKPHTKPNIANWEKHQPPMLKSLPVTTSYSAILKLGAFCWQCQGNSIRNHLNSNTFIHSLPFNIDMNLQHWKFSLQFRAFLLQLLMISISDINLKLLALFLKMCFFTLLHQLLSLCMKW